MHLNCRQLLRWASATAGAALVVPLRAVLAQAEADRLLAVSCAGPAGGQPSLTLVHAETLQVVATLPAPGVMAFPASRWAYGRDVLWGGYQERVAGISLSTGALVAGIDTRSAQNATEITPDGRFVLAAARGTDRIYKIGAEPGTPNFGRVVEMAEHYSGASPSDITMLSDGSYCFTPDRGGDTISIFQVNPLKKVVTVQLDRRGGAALQPAMLTASPDDTLLFVECARAPGTELVIDISNPSRPAEVKRWEQLDGLGMGPSTNEFTPDGRFNLIVNRGSADLTVIDVARLEIRGRVPLPEGSAPTTGAFQPEGTRFFVPLPGRDSVAMVNVPEFEVTQFVAVAPRPMGIAYVESLIPAH